MEKVLIKFHRGLDNISEGMLSKIQTSFFPKKHKDQIVRIYLLCQFRNILNDFFNILINQQFYKNINSSMECYQMDGKIIQIIIKEIIETEEYTLEGIAYYTKIPLDVIFDAACGNNIHPSITLWSRIIELYIQVKPEVHQKLVSNIRDLLNKN